MDILKGIKRYAEIHCVEEPTSISHLFFSFVELYKINSYVKLYCTEAIAMSNSIESYSMGVFSRAVGKKNIRLQKDF